MRLILRVAPSGFRSLAGNGFGVPDAGAVVRDQQLVRVDSATSANAELTVIDATDHTSFTLHDAIPDDHFVVGSN